MIEIIIEIKNTERVSGLNETDLGIHIEWYSTSIINRLKFEILVDAIDYTPVIYERLIKL